VEAKKALVLFAGVFVLYLTEAIPLPVTSLAVVPVAALTGTVRLNEALAGFASSSVYLIVGAFILATAMVKTRLADRITFAILARLGSSTWRIGFGIMLANMCLAFLVPSATAR
ncbi:SLC13 family permease, partial [Enterobacter bugandensis]|uniref:SLC13 family permease n=1 Tax=Enterobacter bugandensis TaxID=881260 RepID=UPI001954EED8